MNTLRHNWKLVLLRIRIKRALKPDQVFLDSAREKFLLSLVERYGIQMETTSLSSSMRWRYAVIITLIVCSMGGLGVFADTTNVAPDHPLYEFKRISEQVRLHLSTPDHQVALHQVFATRRLEEIKAIEKVAVPTVVAASVQPVATVTPVVLSAAKTAKVADQSVTSSSLPVLASVSTRPILEKLDSDFRNEIMQGIEQDEKIDTRGERRKALCQILLQAVQQNLIKSHKSERIEARCATVGN